MTHTLYPPREIVANGVGAAMVVPASGMAATRSGMAATRSGTAARPYMAGSPHADQRVGPTRRGRPCRVATKQGDGVRRFLSRGLKAPLEGLRPYPQAGTHRRRGRKPRGSPESGRRREYTAESSYTHRGVGTNRRGRPCGEIGVVITEESPRTALNFV